MGGFKPSRADIAGATTVGSVQTDLHQFTGSVDITGSLKLNGSSVTGGGGGGGAVANYTNSGNNRVITSVDSDTINGEANLTFDGTKMGVGSNHTPTAVLHVSSSTTTLPLFRVDQHDQAGSKPIVFVTGSGLVGIGTDAPSHLLHLQSSGKASLLLEADTDNTPETDTAYIKLTQDGAATRMILGLNGNASADPDGVYLANAMSNAGIVGPRTAGSPLQLVTSNRAKICVQDDGQVGIGDGFNESTRPTAILHVSGGILAQGTSKTSPLMLVEHDANDNILFVTGSGRVGIGTNAPQQALSVSGSAAFSGSFGNTAVQTLNVASASVDVTTGNTIIDATSLANNKLYAFGIRDGLFTGQQKNIVFKVTFGGAPGNTNGVELTGSNIASPLPGASTGVLSLSGSDPGFGGGYQQIPVATTQLLWDGADWQVLAATNIQYGAR